MPTVALLLVLKREVADHYDAVYMVIVGEDIDILVLLIGLVPVHENVGFLEMSKGNMRRNYNIQPAVLNF